MNSFIVRIELHGAASEATYIKLHDAMEKAGFSRKILADDQTVYSLPNAMYTIDSLGNAEAIRNSVASVAATTGHSAKVFVAQMSTWAARGLVAVPRPLFATTR